MNYSDKLALIREYKNQGGKGSYLSLLSEVKQMPDGGTIQASNLPPKAYNLWQGALSTPSNVSNTFIRPNHIVQDNIYQPPLPGYANVKYDLDNPPEFAGTFKPVEIKPTNVPYRNDVASRREDLKKIPITTTNSKEYPKATQVEFMKQQVADRPDYERLNDFTNFAATGFGLAPMGVLDNVVEGAIGLGGKYLPKALNKVENTVGNITGKKFKSEIDWNKWSTDAVDNPDIVKHLNSIEKKSKKSGTWMKDFDIVDGKVKFKTTDFKGSPEEFIVQQSDNFTKAFPQGYHEMYRGSNRHVYDYVNHPEWGAGGDKYGKAVFGTNEKAAAQPYGWNRDLDTAMPDFNPSDSRLSYNGQMRNGDFQGGTSKLAIRRDLPTVRSDAGGNNWRMLPYNDKIASGVKSAESVKNFQDELLMFKDEYNLKGYSPNKKYLSTDLYANYVTNPLNKEAVAVVDNVVDTMGDRYTIPFTEYIFDPKRVSVKSLQHNIKYDMSNPNIYKSLIPALGAGYVGSKFINNKNND